MLARELSRATELRRADDARVGWSVSPGLIDYPDAVRAMEHHVDAIVEGRAGELVWLLEHPAVYTAGVSARAEDLIDPRFPVHSTARGGRHTYHGPGQRVAYVMLDLRARGRDVHALVRALEGWTIDALAALGVRGETRAERVGVWVERTAGGVAPREDKIAALGVKVRRWVSFHGISLNVTPDLEHFGGIVPCGIQDHGVTSLAELGRGVRMGEVDAALKTAFVARFGDVEPASAPP